MCGATNTVHAVDVQSNRSVRAGRDDMLNRTQMYTVRIAALSCSVCVAVRAFFSVHFGMLYLKELSC